MAESSAPPEKERRKHLRATLKTQVSIISESNFYTGFTGDISEGGLFVATHQVAPRGTSFQLEFTLPDKEEPISVAGEVRWVREYNPSSDGEPGMGLLFLDLQDEDRQRISQFIALRDSLFYDD